MLLYVLIFFHLKLKMRNFKYTGIYSINDQNDDVITGHIVSEKCH